MSYCRFSSDDFQCDVYVYADTSGGWTTHVAGNRITPRKPLPPPVKGSGPRWAQRWVRRNRRVSELLENGTREDITLPYAGGSFNHATPGECADWLEELRDLGYRVPQYAIDDLREEQGENDVHAEDEVR